MISARLQNERRTLLLLSKSTSKWKELTPHEHTRGRQLATCFILTITRTRGQNISHLLCGSLLNLIFPESAMPVSAECAQCSTIRRKGTLDAFGGACANLIFSFRVLVLLTPLHDFFRTNIPKHPWNSVSLPHLSILILLTFFYWVYCDVKSDTEGSFNYVL